MATTTEILDIPGEYEYKGKVYKVSRIVTFEMEAMIADWVIQSAIQRLERQRALTKAGARGISEEQYQRALDRLADNQAVGRFEWEGDLTMQAVNQLPGNKYLNWLRFRRFDKTVTMELIENIYENEEDSRRLGLLLNPSTAAGEEEAQEETQNLTAASA